MSEIISGYNDTTVFLFKEELKLIDFQWVRKWTIAGSFPAFVEQASSADRLIAAQRGVNIVYVIMWRKDVPLEFDDKLAFRDKQGNIIYIKITTNPLPNRSESMADIIQANAEVWIPPAEVLKEGLPI